MEAGGVVSKQEPAPASHYARQRGLDDLAAMFQELEKGKIAVAAVRPVTSSIPAAKPARLRLR